MMNTSKKLTPIKCNADILTQRYEELKNKIPRIHINWFKAEQWESCFGVGKVNNLVLSELLAEYYNGQDGYWESGTTMNNYYASDLADDDIIVIGSNDTYLGVIAVCEDEVGVLELLIDIINDSNLKTEHLPTKDNLGIKPMTFAPYDI